MKNVIHYKVFDEFLTSLVSMQSLFRIVDDIVCFGYHSERNEDDPTFVTWSANAAFSTDQAVHRFHVVIGIGMSGSEEDLKKLVESKGENHIESLAATCDDLDFLLINGFIE